VKGTNLSGSADDVTPNAGEISIDASQLRPGVHVRLPVPWMEHEFMFSSFVIADEEQARLIAAMHLPQLFCDPTRCKVPPLPLPSDRQRRPRQPATPEQEAEAARLATLAATHMAEKLRALAGHERTPERSEKRLDNSTRRYYLGAAKTVGGALRGFATSAREAMNQFVTVSEESTTALLADPDSAIMLIADMAQQRWPRGARAVRNDPGAIARQEGGAAGSGPCGRSPSARSCTTSASCRSIRQSCAAANATGTRQRSIGRTAAAATTRPCAPAPCHRRCSKQSCPITNASTAAVSPTT
jgi:hypothetical protein